MHQEGCCIIVISGQNKCDSFLHFLKQYAFIISSTSLFGVHIFSIFLLYTHFYIFVGVGLYSCTNKPWFTCEEQRTTCRREISQRGH